MEIRIPEFRYLTTTLDKIEILEKGKKIKINGIALNTTQRFWDSLCSRFGLSLSSFNLFEPNDVMHKLATSEKNPNITMVTQTTPFGNEPDFKYQLLAISGTERSSIDADHLVNICKKISPLSVEYHEGVFTCRFEPRTEMSFNVGKEKLISRFVLETPVDGYGKPNIWLGFLVDGEKIVLRGMNKKYQSGINFGKDGKPQDTLLRIIESFSNEDGYMVLKDNILKADNSWTSVGEIVAFIKFIWGLTLADFARHHIKSFRQTDETRLKMDIIRSLSDKTGDLRTIYGVTDLDNLSDRKQRSMPTKVSAYEFLKFMSKQTDILIPPAKRKLQLLIGAALAREYDLG